MNLFELVDSNIGYTISLIASYPLAFLLGYLAALIHARKIITKSKCPHCKESLESL